MASIIFLPTLLFSPHKYTLTQLCFNQPDHGCSLDCYDGGAAYLQAILFVITNNTQYASNSINLLNTYLSKKNYFEEIIDCANICPKFEGF